MVNCKGERRSKADWAGISMGDAFKPNQDFYIQLPAQRLFYSVVQKVQTLVIKIAGASPEAQKKRRVKPQISPFYTSYPSSIAAYASIGLTAFLQFKSLRPDGILFTALKNYLKDPLAGDLLAGNVDRESYRQLAYFVADAVQTRIFLEDLSRYPSLSSIETYRLFSASQQKLMFLSVKEILDAIILYGDILPSFDDLTLHPLTLAIMKDTLSASLQFFIALPETESGGLLELAVSWVKRVCRSLAIYLPPKKEIYTANRWEKKAATQSSPNNRNWKDFKFTKKTPNTEDVEGVPPLKEPKAPWMFPPPNRWDTFLGSSLDKKNASDRDRKLEGFNRQPVKRTIDKTLAEFSKAVGFAARHQKKWEDMPYDEVEKVLSSSGFREGPLQGNPVGGHEITVKIGEGEAEKGEIFDRPVELSHNLEGYRKLCEESEEITSKLRRVLYPNIEPTPQIEQVHTSGSLDPSRLAGAQFLSALFKRYRIHQKQDRKGQPLLVIAADGSGSLNAQQMRMLKILTAAWLNSTHRTGIKVLAGLYHSGRIRPGLTAPLVQWIYHPWKTPSIGRADASRALVSLPNYGTGIQSDALSIKFIMDEAQRVAQGKMIYLVLITDCMWNRSFRSGKTGHQEVYSVLKAIKKKMSTNLHFTLVSLRNPDKGSIEDLTDKTILIPQNRLLDSKMVAEQVSIYVAQCIGERKRIIRKER
jgi:hypothetical protein